MFHDWFSIAALDTERCTKKYLSLFIELPISQDEAYEVESYFSSTGGQFKVGN